MKVKILVQALLLCSLHELVWGAFDMAEYKAKSKDCIKELKILSSEALLIEEGKEVPNPSEDFKCFHHCLYKKMGLMDATGKANQENILKFAKARFAKSTLDNIKDQLTSCTKSLPKYKPGCDYTYSLEQCMAKAIPA